MTTTIKHSKCNRDIVSLHDSMSTDDDRQDLNRSEIACSACELNLYNHHEDKAVQQQISYDDAMDIDKIRTEHQINSNLSGFLPQLRDFEIVFVCDDSGSMTTSIDGTENTRWTELCKIVKRLLPITLIYDENGVDIHFLNRGKYPKIKKAEDVDHAFARKPSSYTPLVPVLRNIFQSPMACPGREKKLLVLVATDGRPTDEDGNEEIEEFERLMKDIRNAKTTYVSFLLCTDEQECVDYLTNWDETMENVDITDDYHTEKGKIRRCQEDPNYRFTYDDYIVKALMGSIIPQIDRLDEPKEKTAKHS